MRIFSGIQPSGTLHLGNYLGAMKNWLKLQEDPKNGGDIIYCIVDLHSITVDYDPKELSKRIISAAKDIISIGIDLEKVTIFRQSDIYEHTELAWFLTTLTSIGELNRMTQYKEKAQKHSERAGLFNYPILMASDILLYKAQAVPVGEDQLQHLELARVLAKRFNTKFGNTFFEPKPILSNSKRILSLQSESKMSKSDSPNTYIALSDTPDIIRKKIQSAVTDDGTGDTISPNTLNLFRIYGELTDEKKAENLLDQRKMGLMKYADFKRELAEVIIGVLDPIQKKRSQITDEDIKKILLSGAEKLRPVAQETMKEVRQKMGLVI